MEKLMRDLNWFALEAANLPIESDSSESYSDSISDSQPLPIPIVEPPTHMLRTRDIGCDLLASMSSMRLTSPPTKKS
jgi:hypothetical protein